MNCIIPSGNLKIISKSLHTLARIGDELYIEARPDYLQFAAINQNKTSYVTFNFVNVFFSTYELDDLISTSQSSNTITCKLSIKAILGIFKTKGPKEKKIDWCKIEIANDPIKIVFKLKYKQDVTVVHSLRIIDTEFISVSYDQNSMDNQINSTGCFYTQVLTNFQASDGDMSLDVKNNKITVRNYDVASNNIGKCIRSQVVLNSNEFTNYRIGKECSLTMSFKPFRAAVSFAELFSLPIIMHFDTGGKPVILTIKNPTFEVNFVLSTINPDGSTQSCATSSTTGANAVKKRTQNGALSREDKTLLENLNWDSDFDPDENDYLLDNNDIIIGKNKNKCEKNVIVEPMQDVVPNSPESPRTKRLKIVFRRCFEPTYSTSMLNFGEELAPNSDDSD